MRVNKYRISILFLLCFLVESLIAQPPPFWFLQNIAKDNVGNPARNRTIHILSSIFQGGPVGGKLVYEESHQVKADNDGVFGYTMGRGAIQRGLALKDSLSQIEWDKGPFFLRTKVAIAPSIPAPWWIPADNYIDIGTSQILSVPYALYASNASINNVTTGIANGPKNTLLTTDSTGKVNWNTPQSMGVTLSQVTTVNLVNIVNGQNARIPPHKATVVDVLVPNIKPGDPIIITPLDDYPNWTVYGAWCKSEGVVSIRFANFTSKAVDILGSQYKIMIVK